MEEKEILLKMQNLSPFNNVLQIGHHLADVFGSVVQPMHLADLVRSETATLTASNHFVKVFS